MIVELLHYDMTTEFVMRVLFSLILVSLSASAMADTPATPKKDKPICKRYAEIGSMIPTRKECHTRDEWNKLAQEGRSGAQDMMDRRVAASPQGQ